MQQLPKPLTTPFCFLSNIQLGLLSVSHTELHVPNIHPDLTVVQSFTFPSSQLQMLATSLRAASLTVPRAAREPKKRCRRPHLKRLNGDSFIHYLEKCRRCFLGLV